MGICDVSRTVSAKARYASDPMTATATTTRTGVIATGPMRGPVGRLPSARPRDGT
jgi:hypothetical protein